MALAYGGRELYLRFTHIYEYDARATADIVTVSSRADGWVMEMPALEGTRVAAGQVVARIDDRVAKLRADALRAQIEGVRAERARLRAERRLDENQADALDAHADVRASRFAKRRWPRCKSDLDLAQARARAQLVAVRASRDQRAPAPDGAGGGDQARKPDPAAPGGTRAGRRQPRRGAGRARPAGRDRRADRRLDHQVANLAAQLAQQKSTSRTARSAARCRP